MFIILLTGLSGSGKTTLAGELQKKLAAKAIPVQVFDGDLYRKTVNADLGFSAADRRENISRLSKLANETCSKGIISIIAAINPYEDQRTELNKKFGAKIIWVYCTVPTLVKRDTKGLYYKALLPDNHPEKLWNLTGINDPYENPEHPDLIIDTSESTIEASVNQLFNYILSLIKT